MYLYLEDGSVFKGNGITSAQDSVGLVSYYTGVVGYQEIATDPANTGKIILFTYPEIGNYGVNSEDAESPAPVVSGVIAKEYCPYYSNFRAEGSLKDYLQKAGIPFLDQVDTRAVLLALREKGEMWGVISSKELTNAECGMRIAEYREKLNIPQRTQRGAEVFEAENKRVTAKVLDFGAPKSFYKTLAERGVQVNDDESAADIVIVGPVPFFAVDDAGLVDKVKPYVGKKPLLGIADGAALVAGACGLKPAWMDFGHHGVNLPARFLPTDRKEITVQNHNFIIDEQPGAEIIFDNINDHTPEGFLAKDKRAAGVSFMPDAVWFADILRIMEVA